MIFWGFLFQDNFHWEPDRIFIKYIYINYDKMNTLRFPIMKPNVYVFGSFRACSFLINFISSDFIRFFFFLMNEFSHFYFYLIIARTEASY